MYLVVIHIPIYVEGDRYYTDISWQRDLLLARDWLARPFRYLTLLAPSLPIEAVDDKIVHPVPIGADDGIRVVPSFDLRCRARHFWLKQRRQWMADVRRELCEAKVIHTSADDVFRPLSFLAHGTAVKSNVTTVLVGPDMDYHAILPANVRGRLICFVFDLLMRRATRRADLVLLKEGLVHDRYARYGKNVKAFCGSMHRDEDVIGETQLERRLETLQRNRPLRAVYAGRFIPRKGLHDAVAAIAIARQKDVAVEYHLFGSGPEESALRRQAAELGVQDLVSFQGFVEYSPQFIAHLAEFDLLLFMPTEEDTPRMLYDAMAAGLPLLGSRIPFLSHRVKTDQAGVLVNVGDSNGAAEHLRSFHAEPERLKKMARSARAAGGRHSVEKWYQRRADWTMEAVQRHLSKDAAQ